MWTQLNIKGIYGLDSSIVSCFKVYENLLNRGATRVEIDEEINKRLGYYRAKPRIDNAQYYSDFIEYVGKVQIWLDN